MSGLFDGFAVGVGVCVDGSTFAVDGVDELSEEAGTGDAASGGGVDCEFTRHCRNLEAIDAELLLVEKDRDHCRLVNARFLADCPLIL